VTAARPDWRRVVDDFVDAKARFKAHRTGRNSALVAHYGFMSVFPLLLVFTTMLGFVLQGNSGIRQRILDSALNRIPMIGQTLESSPERLKGSVPILIIGLVTALWAGLRAFNVLQTALDDIAEIPLAERPSFFRTRARSLIGILLVGVSQVGAALLSGLIAISGVGWLNRVLLVLGTVALNIGVLGGTYRWLCSRRAHWRQLAPGAIGGGVGFTVLQVLGTTIVARAISRATPVYGNFASVIGLFTWLSLHALVALAGAELNGARRA
jgi:uncharacterized BrkB/YihY/UPF0761 family membrane protein